MWYEILPSLGLVYVFITIPPFASRVSNWFLLNKKKQPRFWENDVRDFHTYLRDRRISDHYKHGEYWPKGLEGIPDAK